MSITHAQYETQVATAASTKAATVAAAETTRQESVNAVGVNAGANPQLGCSNSQIAAINAANVAKLASLYAAEQARQQTLMVQRDLLRDGGNREPL